MIDELLTLFVVRREKAKGVEWLRAVLDGGGTRVVQVDAQCFADAYRVYRDFADKQWSFTDCTSYAVMQRLSIAKAFSFDEHFRQFGTVQVVP